ncbi:MAG: hypothetical protein R6U50_00335 [Desulfobacterales bacterium]
MKLFQSTCEDLFTNESENYSTPSCDGRLTDDLVLKKKDYYIYYAVNGEFSFYKVKILQVSSAITSDSLLAVPEVWDIRKCDLTKITEKEILKMSFALTEKFQFLPGEKMIALIINNIFQEKLVGLLKWYIDDDIIKVKVFADFEDADDWLKRKNKVHILP